MNTPRKNTSKKITALVTKAFDLLILAGLEVCRGNNLIWYEDLQKEVKKEAK